MLFISSKTASYLRCCFLFTIAFYAFKDVSAITEQPMLLLVGQAMNVEKGFINDNNKGLIGMFGILFASLGFIDLLQLFLDNTKYFEAIVPSRLTIFFGISAYSYCAKESVLHNDLVFVYSFLEIWVNFLLYNVLREEKHKRNKRFEQQLEKELLQVQQGQMPIEEILERVERTQDI